jgi:hypothetical protein
VLASQDIGSPPVEGGGVAADIVSDLSRPAAYPEPRPEEVTVAGTLRADELVPVDGRAPIQAIVAAVQASLGDARQA